MTNEQAHRRARERGPSRVLYAVVRMLAATFMRIWFRLAVTGADNIPESGAAIVTPNHKSFWDSFFLGAATRRHVRFMGKAELFEGWKGPLLIRLGAFPVRRGRADAEALETARVIVEQGGLLSLFPEGTRIREPDELGPPKRGAARLALETGAPLVPAALTGTDHLFLGPIPKPKRVRLAIGEPIPVHELEATPEAAAKVLDEELWPRVETQFKGLLLKRGALAAGVAALGLGGAAYARKRGGVGPRSSVLGKLRKPRAKRRSLRDPRKRRR